MNASDARTSSFPSLASARYSGVHAVNRDSLDEPTNAQSPQALSPRGDASGSMTRPREGASGVGLAEGLDRSRARRMRGFYAFGVGSALVVILVTLALGGDARARQAFQAGMGVFGATNVVLWWLTRSGRALDPRVQSAHWIIAGLGLLPAVYYFGPFSAVTLAYPLALMFVALDRERTTANVVLGIAIGEHLVVAVPIILGLDARRGTRPRRHGPRATSRIAEVLIIGLISRRPRPRAVGSPHERDGPRRAGGRAADHRRSEAGHRGGPGQGRTRSTGSKTGRWTGQTVGRWQLGSVLGRGAMGEVYEAHDARGQARGGEGPHVRGRGVAVSSSSGSTASSRSPRAWSRRTS